MTGSSAAGTEGQGAVHRAREPAGTWGAPRHVWSLGMGLSHFLKAAKQVSFKWLQALIALKTYHHYTIIAGYYRHKYVVTYRGLIKGSCVEKLRVADPKHR